MRLIGQFGYQWQIIPPEGIGFLPLVRFLEMPRQGDIVHDAFLSLVFPDGGFDITVADGMRRSLVFGHNESPLLMNISAIGKSITKKWIKAKLFLIAGSKPLVCKFFLPIMKQKETVK